MRKLTLLCLLLAVFLVSCAPFDSKENGKFNRIKETGMEVKESFPRSFFPKDINVVAAGDSLTQGVGDSTDSGGYIPYLKAQLEDEQSIKKAHFENFGVRGNRTEQLQERLEGKKFKSSIRQADLIILTIGGNDLMKVVRENFSGLELDQFQSEQLVFKEKLQAIFMTIRNENPEAPIVLIGLYNPFYHWFSDVEEMNQIINEWNQQSRTLVRQDGNAYFVDIHDIFLNNEENLLYSDYFHPNDRGYQLIADRVFDMLDTSVLHSLGE
ncbi:SGNH/GDSL hydrolase family protein [Bacillus sp. REN3]|uniref:SGNH/GDSL hydrolase family protein n=1 Tax=Bacillus sp. REN3 TaxID=2802440 RepID=UPI001AEF1B14|nr:SGNH/GDSL hydrolase family protein [Bacillus sp. REN3]